MANVPKWFTDHKPGHAEWYIQRFRTMAAEGTDLAGEARLVDALVAPGSRILDAGCGPGRVGAVLHARGHTVVGVDADPLLVAAAIEDHPGPSWLVGDLAELDLTELDGHGEPFDAAVVAGNVMVFVASGTEASVLQRLSAHVRSGGKIVVGFATDRGYALEEFDVDVATAGLTLEHRFATWDLEPLSPDADFAVTVLRVP